MIVSRGLGRGAHRGSIVAGGMGRWLDVLVRRIKLLLAIVVSKFSPDLVVQSGLPSDITVDVSPTEHHVFKKPN